MPNYIDLAPKLMGNEKDAILRVREKIDSVRINPSHNDFENMLRVLISLVFCPVSSVSELILRIDEAQNEDEFLPHILPNIKAKLGQKNIINPSHVSEDDRNEVQQIFGEGKSNLYLDSLIHYSRSLLFLDTTIHHKKELAKLRAQKNEDEKLHPILRRLEEAKVKNTKKEKFLNKTAIHDIIKDIVKNKHRCLSGDQFASILSHAQIEKLKQLDFLFTVSPEILLKKSANAILAMLFFKVALHFEELPKRIIRRNSPAVSNFALEWYKSLQSHKTSDYTPLNIHLVKLFLNKGLLDDKDDCEASANDLPLDVDLITLFMDEEHLVEADEDGCAASANDHIALNSYEGAACVMP